MIIDISWCLGGGCVATCGSLGSVFVWEGPGNLYLSAFAGHDGTVNCVRWNYFTGCNEIQVLASSGEDASVRI